MNLIQDQHFSFLDFILVCTFVSSSSSLLSETSSCRSVSVDMIFVASCAKCSGCLLVPIEQL